jgi:hypothetical protein
MRCTRHPVCAAHWPYAPRFYVSMPVCGAYANVRCQMPPRGQFECLKANDNLNSLNRRMETRRMRACAQHNFDASAAYGHVRRICPDAPDAFFVCSAGTAGMRRRHAHMRFSFLIYHSDSLSHFHNLFIRPSRGPFHTHIDGI